METTLASTTMVTSVMTLTPTDIIVDTVAVTIGLAAVISIVRLNRKLGGKIKSALWFFILGVFSNMFALIWAAFFGHTYTIGTITLDVHDLFMALGMVFFTVSAYRFSLLVPRE